jgi:murein hydrolase activator
MRGVFALLLCPLLAASAPAPTGSESLDAQIKGARAEQAVADAELARLNQVAAKAHNDVERLRAQQAAAAQAIEAAEARITSADAQARLISSSVAAHRRQLIEEQRPASLLLAGLAVMARRPPVIVLADGGSPDELVKVRILLDSTLPTIRARTGHISAELEDGRRLQQAMLAARGEMVQSQNNLIARRREFASLERKALVRAFAVGSQALAAGDVALAVGEQTERLQGSQSARRSAAALAAELLSQGPAAPRPWPGEGAAIDPHLAYQLPAAAPVTDGLGAVNASGMTARGLTLATERGASVTAPADGVVRFSGPFRDYDGVLIIDHGGGWMSLIVNVSSTLQPGRKVRLGDPVGKALGPLLVELSQNGRRISPALIAGSSQSLSKAAKGG